MRMAEWRKTSLGECATFQEGYVNPPQGVARYFDGPVKWLRAVDLNDGFIWETSRTLSEDGYRSAGKSASLFVPGSLAISKSGTIGRLGILKDYMCGNRAVINIKPMVEQCIPRFLFYALRIGRPEIETLAEGSVQRNLYVSALSKFRLRLPSLIEQAEIASVLGTLDDKIELNRRMNETLEAMARAIFTDWFVDFGPTRAKQEGRAPYLAPDIWSFFPDRLDDEGKPEGWSASAIGQEVDVVGGSTPSTKEPEFWDGDHAWATPKDLSSLSTPVLLSTERQITAAGLSQISSGLLPVGTVLLSSRAPIGYMAIAHIPTAVNQGFIAMICHKRLSNIFVWLWTQANMETVHQNANGSTFQEISKANFRPIPVTVAQPDVLSAFDDTARSLFDRIVSNEKENLSLAATRDFLLPKLMSGEVRVSDVASLV